MGTMFLEGEGQITYSGDGHDKKKKKHQIIILPLSRCSPFKYKFLQEMGIVIQKRGAGEKKEGFSMSND